MNKFRLIIGLIWSVILSVSSVPHRNKGEIIRTFHNGEAVAIDVLIQKYEEEHQKFYEEAVVDGDYLEWPALDNKNLSTYCRKYLKQTIPGRTTDYAIGVKIQKVLHYNKENTRTTGECVVVQCKFMYKSHRLIYYMTRAPEPNCVYSLKSTGNWRYFILTIINKYCNFEDKPFTDRSLRRERINIVCKKHHHTGQPIANQEYLLKFEMEHQELFKREGFNGDYSDIVWPYAIEHTNLNFYCHQYMKKIVPGRNRVGVKGMWKTEKLHYQKLNTNRLINVTTISCQPDGASRVIYYMTRAPNTNCVYALLRKSRGVNVPLVIIFRHCDFEEPNNNKTIPQDYDMLIKEVNPETEVKEQTLDILEALLLLSQD